MSEEYKDARIVTMIKQQEDARAVHVQSWRSQLTFPLPEPSSIGTQRQLNTLAAGLAELTEQFTVLTQLVTTQFTETIARLETIEQTVTKLRSDVKQHET